MKHMRSRQFNFASAHNQSESKNIDANIDTKHRCWKNIGTKTSMLKVLDVLEKHRCF